MSGQTAKGGGLEGVVVADTRLSDVDGERGRLIIAGQDVEQLTGTRTFEDVCALLWRGELPSADARTALSRALGEARVRAFERLPRLGAALEAADGMDALRGSVAQLSSPARADEASFTELTGALAVYAAAWSRRRQGQAPVAPDPTQSHATDYLRMVRGDRPTPAQSAGIDAYLVTVSDHGMNASTFAARVVASTGSDAVSAVTAAIGALKGPLHGGAPGPVLDMLDAIDKPERAEAWLAGELEAGRRVMGMGHRIYRVRDPRAAVLERAVERLESSLPGAQGRLPLARAVEKASERLLRERYPNRPLKANVEFYTAILLDALGLPRTLFTPTFAVSRVAGWCAHVAEQQASGRLIRPSSQYVGAVPVTSS